MAKKKQPVDRLVSNATRRLKSAEARVRTARRKAHAAEIWVSKAKVAYAVARPLTPVERETIAQRIVAGNGICCDDGFAWLRTQFPEPWAQALNEWAYVTLGCKGQHQYLAESLERVRSLELDRFPS